ncbi:type 2 lanthipeptide synthetase LanM family protein [Aristaeella hokkaidonensis]|uniref:Type 2 lantipeptide synthetase LanM family protein n=1 Tax=Aristaeella hokkaidonensis TaxID=3046382 RepID=A0AC61N6B1_9FIRM|nr:type 2 lanthipeptide synthetase LanM family protein [Aristaeella hokkaidonensis]QTE69794.1 type 2 lantipeptide synthetase LanM family protein [Clostridiales bacterium FE2011]QUC66618.1 type 2 lantipeptide synthetase LanM family protein [Aristaeella hokkaidonensis]SNT95209.1 type 2 lantibiotic biosynthesis protein LanM [Aristaeella hokkaidonensis]
MKLLVPRQSQQTDAGFDFQDSLSFWDGLFPEIKERTALLNSLKSLGEQLDESALRRLFDSQKQISFDFFEQEFNDTYVASIQQGLEAVNEDILGWMNYFKPLLVSCMEPLFNRIHHCSVVLEPRALFCRSVSALARILFQMAFRVLIAETNASRDEGLLKGADTVARATYYKEVLLQDVSYLKAVYSRYQVLTDMMLKKTGLICEYIESIITDYETNHEAIGRELNGGSTFGKLVHIRLGEGDTHNQGKSVAIIEFEQGILVYKPRTLQLEQRYNTFIEHLNAAHIPGFLDIKTIRLKNTGETGWCEFVRQKPCKEEAEVRDYYTRIGELLAIFYLFSASDFHAENIIACGAYPLVIDMETLFSADLFDQKTIEKSVFSYIGSLLTYSVKASAILPTMIRNRKTNKQVDLSGLSMDEEQESPYKSFCIMDADKDTIHIVAKNLAIGGHNNSVKLHNRSMESQKYLGEMLRGFEITYEYFVNNRESVLAYIEEHFSGLMFRVLLRGTVTYGQMLSTMYHPDLVQSFLDREIYLNRLFLNADEKHIALVLAEIEDMKRDDVPMFMASTDERSLYTCAGQALEGIVQNSALEMLRSKLERMGAADLCFQRRVIIYSYADLYRNDVYITGYRYHEAEEAQEPDGESQIHVLVEQVAKYCDANSISLTVNGQTERSWIGYLEVEDQFRTITPIGINLYDGNAGMVLFYAALYKYTQKRCYLETMREVLRPIEQYFEKNSIGKETQNGLYNGCSGAVYLYAVISDLLHEESYRAHADRLLREMASSRVLSQKNDVMIGNAGAILVAARLSEPGDAIIDPYLHTLAQKIIEAADVYPTGCFIGKEGYTGYAHGTAGISHALYKVYKRTGDEHILLAVEKMLAYERGQYVTEAGNFRRSLTDKRCDCKWCHGMSGILLNRLSLKEDGYSDSLLDSEIEIGIRTLKQVGFGADYCLCHGDIGNLMILQQAAVLLQDGALQQQVRRNTERLATQLIERLKGSPDFLENAGFGLMTGLAGIGYGLIALEDRNARIPNILAV